MGDMTATRLRRVGWGLIPWLGERKREQRARERVAKRRKYADEAEERGRTQQQSAAPVPGPPEPPAPQRFYGGAASSGGYRPFPMKAPPATSPIVDLSSGYKYDLLSREKLLGHDMNLGFESKYHVVTSPTQGKAIKVGGFLSPAGEHLWPEASTQRLQNWLRTMKLADPSLATPGRSLAAVLLANAVEPDLIFPAAIHASWRHYGDVPGGHLWLCTLADEAVGSQEWMRFGGDNTDALLLYLDELGNTIASSDLDPETAIEAVELIEGP